MKAAAKPGKKKKDEEEEDSGDDSDDHDVPTDDEEEGHASAEESKKYESRMRGEATDAASHLPSSAPPLTVATAAAAALSSPHRHHPAPSSQSSAASAAASGASAAGTGAGAATTTAQQPKRKAAKDRERPKRALSMFNFFFREEREKLMAERLSGTGALAEADQRGIDEGKDANTRKKELFALVGKIIAERWKHVSPDEIERLKGLADDDMVRFNDEMSEYQINIARKKRVKEEATATSEAKVSGAADRRFPMYPREPALNLYQPIGHPMAAAPLAMSASLQRPGLSVDDQLQRDPSLRLPTPIEDLLRARRQAVLGEYTPTSPNTAPSHSPQRHHPHQGLSFQDQLAASQGSSGLLQSGSLRRESMMPSTLLGSAAAAARPYVPSLDSSMGGGGSAYDTQQNLLMQLLQQDRYRLLSGSSAMDPLSSLGMGRQVGGYPHATQPSSFATGLGGFPSQQQQHALQHQALHQHQQLRHWPEAQSSILGSSSDALLSQLQRQERDMLSLLRQQQQQQAGVASLSEATQQQQRPSYQELLQLQQQQMDHQEQMHQHLRRTRRDSDSEGQPDPYP